MKYFIIAGEASGDLHAANLMKGLIKADPDAEFRFMGGDLMEEVAEGRMLHYRETAYMMLDVLFHLRKIFRNLSQIKREILDWQPDVLIPVDYPGFNMRISRFAAKNGIRVFYFISPKVWAWKQRRVYAMKKYVDRIFSILPFEEQFFRGFDMDVEYFGNPLVDQVDAFRKAFPGEKAWRKQHGLDDRPLVALLAGSRIREIETTLPAMLELAAEHPSYCFVVAGAPSMDISVYSNILEGSDMKVLFDETYALMHCARAAMINSGTASLEASLFELPQVVLYRTSRLAYVIGKRLIKVNFISLVNLIYGSKVVEEVIQLNLAEQARPELKRILEDEVVRREMKKRYREVIDSLGYPGVSERVGSRMLDLIKAEKE